MPGFWRSWSAGSSRGTPPKTSCRRRSCAASAARTRCATPDRPRRGLSGASERRHRSLPRQGARSRTLAQLAAESGEASAAPDQELQAVVCACITGLLDTLKPDYASALRRVELDGVTVKGYAEEAGSRRATPGCGCTAPARHCAGRSARAAGPASRTGVWTARAAKPPRRHSGGSPLSWPDQRRCGGRPAVPPPLAPRAPLQEAPDSSGGPDARATWSALTFPASNRLAEAVIFSMVSSKSAVAPRLKRRGLMRATTNARR